MNEIRKLIKSTLVAYRSGNQAIRISPQDESSNSIENILIEPTSENKGRLAQLIRTELSNAKVGVKYFFTPLTEAI